MDFKNFFSGLKRQMIGYQDGMSPVSRMRNQPLGMEFTEHGGMTPDGLTSILFGGARESIDENQDEMATRRQNKRQGIADGIGALGTGFANAFAGQGQKKSNLAEMFGGFRATGGPVKKGKAYIVGEEGEEVLADKHGAEIIGERGEELIVPDSDGMVIPANETVEKPMSRRQQLEQTLGKTTAELDRRNNKDFKGKDRDDDHNFKDVLRSGGLGFLQAIANADIGNARGMDALGQLLGRGIGGAGTGAVMGAFDRNADEKLGNEMQKSRLAQQYGQQAKMLDAELGMELKQAQRNTIQTDDIRQAADLKRKIAKDEATTAYWNRKADQNDLKIANDVELMALRDKWATSKDKNDERRLNLVEQEMRNRNLRNAENNKTRRDIAGLTQAAQDKRQAIAIEAQKVAAEIRAAQAAGQKDKEIAARERLARLKKDDDDIVSGLNVGSTPIQ